MFLPLRCRHRGDVRGFFGRRTGTELVGEADATSASRVLGRRRPAARRRANGIRVYRDIPEELLALIEPVLRDHDLELVDLDLVKGRAPWLVRLTIDTPTGDGRVSVDRCAGVSREVGTQLEAANAIPVSYRLEVSSPGLDRRLGREKYFANACGGEVRIETRRPLDGRRRFRGQLLGFENGVARVTVDGSEVEIPFAEMIKASAVYAFTPSDFGRGVGR